MQRFLVLGAATLCLGLVAQSAGSYSTYRNARFGYVVLYPNALMSPGRESDNGDGRVFKSRDGKATLSVWGENNALNRTLRTHMNAAKSDWAKDRGRITYWKADRSYYVLSGLTGGQIFYEKTISTSDSFATMLWQYPRSQKARFDAALTRTTRAFGAAPRASASSAPRIVVRSTPDEIGY